MARATASQHGSVFRAGLPLTVLCLVVLSAMPVRFLGWTDGLSHLLATVLTPISHPLVLVSTWLAPPDRDAARLGPRAEALEEELRAVELAWLQTLEENGRLRGRLAELQAGRAFNEDIEVRLGAYPVIGSSSDPTSAALRVRAGSVDGVTARSTVATTAGTQLVGRVIDVGASVSTVVPITDPGAGEALDCIILPEDLAGSAGGPAGGVDVRSRGIRCLLFPNRSGRLAGDAEVLNPTAGRPSPPKPEPGMVVRLLDASEGAWPRSARMLVVGVVEMVEPNPDQPLRPLVTVRPTVQLRRLSEVVLRIPVDEGERGDAGGGAS